MQFTKGIILAAGKGTRLSPATSVVSKPLLPVYDKPMLYYALATLMNAGVREVLFISRQEDQKIFKQLFKNGKNLGMKFKYAVQKKAVGIPDAIRIGEKFVHKKPYILALADNIFVGNGLDKLLKKTASSGVKATVLAVKVANPQKSGVIQFDKNMNILSLEEKPKKPKSNFIIPGLYFFNKYSMDYFKAIKKSARGEFEIIDIIKKYLEAENLKVLPLPNHIKWFDTGDANEMLLASNFIQKHQASNTLVAGIEAIALKNKWITKSQFNKLLEKIPNPQYQAALKKL
ncbi:MAG: sugar nucleotidyltransferase [Candidatus Pelagibacterales bacterium]|jgi:glucose-1-phosphate thymidylyltransferase|nr:sugar phosphate nucleotidyltransferase [Pelagibacterales bacterium]MDB9817926.1 sugar phosphate nucleotidyltransferase [Pelagibacterales bacterium]|tara:strand:+ start:923 stop:1786 length:864 start_codon:yes stop_codon:yes gene_type:complete